MDNHEYSVIKTVLKLLHELIGTEDARRDFKPILRFADELVAERRAALQIINFTEVKQNSILEEIRSMLLQLNLTLKVRERKDGRFEIRPTIDGRKVSIYGKTAEELKTKY